MESSSESDTEFEGFGPEIVEAARKELIALTEVNPEDISDVDLSDISDLETDSESEIDGPLEENEDGDRQTWREEFHDVDVEEFTGIPGPTTTLDGTANELDFLNLTFPETLYEMITRETNKYADQAQRKNGEDPK